MFESITFKQCCGAATFLGGSGSRWPRSGADSGSNLLTCLKDAAGAALKNATPAPGSDPKKNRLWLRNTAVTESGSRTPLCPDLKHWCSL